MRHLKMLGLAAIAAMALMAFVGAGTASATTLTVKGVKQTGSVTIKASLKAGTSAIIKDKNGTTNDTCTGSTLEGKTSTTTGAEVGGSLSSLTFTGCSHTTHVITIHSMSFAWIFGGGNATFVLRETKLTIVSTVFGATATCTTGTGTTIGTLTGVASGQATLHVNATTLDCGILGTSSWTGTYVITGPEGLGVTS